MKILNRIVTFILALAVFPAIATRIILRVVVSIAEGSTAYTLLSSIMEDTVNSAMEITVSFKEIVDYIQNGTFSFSGMNFSFDKIPAEMLVTKNWLIASAVFIVLALIIAIIIMGCALFAQAHKTVMCFGAGGAACCFAAISCFTKFAAPFVSGEIDIARFLGQSLLGGDGLIATLGTSVISGAISVDVFQLGNAIITMAIIFIGVALWTFAYFITLPTEAKVKKEKKVKAKKA
ncbi:MAG: hypothetical protein IJ447_09515 [Clostridia bacterium]|nr:hypothetical protein [Clostridia bacterium]